MVRNTWVACIGSSKACRCIKWILLGFLICMALYNLNCSWTWQTMLNSTTNYIRLDEDVSSINAEQHPLTISALRNLNIGQLPDTQSPGNHCNVINLSAQPEYVKTSAVELASDPPINICIYPNDTADWYVSRTIRAGRLWEKPIVDLVAHVLRQDRNMGFIDIGANVGQYSLIAAKMGHQVVAVEALKRHINMMHKSVQLNNVKGNLILVHNAVSDGHRQVYIHQTPGNFGASHIINSTSKPSNNNEASNRGNVAVQSILLDDLLEVIRFRTAVMKIDIEGHEPIAILGGGQLFDRLAISHIFMESGYFSGIFFAKRKDIATKMLHFLYARGYIPYSSRSLKRLPQESWKSWPWDIFFKLESQSDNVWSCLAILTDIV